MKYDPESHSSREALAVALLSKMGECGFRLEKKDDLTQEAVYSRAVDGTDGAIRVLVYTTVVAAVGGATPIVRSCGKDSVRVCAVYSSARTGRERGLVKETRTHRVGEIEDIVNRVYARMRSVYGAALSPIRCDSCGAPTFTSKQKNQVCADLCWKSPEELQRETSPPTRSYANTGYRGYRGSRRRSYSRR